MRALVTAIRRLAGGVPIYILIGAWLVVASVLHYTTLAFGWLTRQAKEATFDLVVLRRIVIGEPRYQPKDTHLLGKQPKTEADVAALEAYAKLMNLQIAKGHAEQPDGSTQLRYYVITCPLEPLSFADTPQIYDANAVASGKRRGRGEDDEPPRAA